MELQIDRLGSSEHRTDVDLVLCQMSRVTQDSHCNERHLLLRNRLLVEIPPSLILFLSRKFDGPTDKLVRLFLDRGMFHFFPAAWNFRVNE